MTAQGDRTIAGVQPSRVWAARRKLATSKAEASPGIATGYRTLKIVRE